MTFSNWILIFSIIIALAALAVGAFWFFNRQKPPAQNRTSSKDEVSTLVGGGGASGGASPTDVPDTAGSEPEEAPEDSAEDSAPAPAPVSADPERDAIHYFEDNRKTSIAGLTSRAFGSKTTQTANEKIAEAAAAALKQSKDFDVQTVFFGTDRAISDTTDKGPEFGADHANALTLGQIDITIPKNAHRLGDVERPKSLKILKLTLWEQKEDPKKHFTIQSCETLEETAFLSAAGAVAQAAESYAGTAFVFIHGFNTRFDTAMFRAAQLAYDLGFDGPAFAYSWPSVGQTVDYLRDVESAEGAAHHMDAFLDTVFRTPGVERVHLVAHSMGNAALAELLTRAGTKLSQRGKAIDQLILAAPDLDAAKFAEIVQFFTNVAKDVTLYACASDRALLASQALRTGSIRLGDVGPDGPSITPGVESIDISAVGSEVFSLNHSTYAENRGLLNDLGTLLRTGLHPPPRRMPTIREITGTRGVYWRLPR